MKYFRFSLYRCMISIAVIAFFLFVARLPSEWQSSILFSSAIALQIAAGLRSMATTGTIRKKWLAFFLAGSSYLFLVFGPWCSSQVAPTLITTRLLEEAYRLSGGIYSPHPYGLPLSLSGTTSDLTMVYSNDYYDRMRGLEKYNDYMRITQSIIAICLSFISYMIISRVPSSSLARKE